MISKVRGTATVFQQETFEASIVGFAHRGVNTNIGGNSCQHNVGDSTPSQQHVQIGRPERAFPWFIDDRFARLRSEFRNDLPSRFSSNQNFPTRAGISDPGSDSPAAPPLIVR